MALVPLGPKLVPVATSTTDVPLLKLWSTLKAVFVRQVVSNRLWTACRHRTLSSWEAILVSITPRTENGNPASYTLDVRARGPDTVPAKPPPILFPVHGTLPPPSPKLPPGKSVTHRLTSGRRAPLLQPFMKQKAKLPVPLQHLPVSVTR